MNRGIIEFHPLANSDGAGTDYQNAWFIALGAFRAAFIGAVVVWGVAGKLAGTGIDNFLNRQNILFLSHLANLVGVQSPELGNFFVRKPIPFYFG